MTHNPSGMIETTWQDQRQWSHAAGALKRNLGVWRSIALTLAITGAILATLSTQVGLKTELGRNLSIGATVALALVPVIRTALLGRKRIEDWTRARSASEGFKKHVYLYLTRTTP